MTFTVIEGGQSGGPTTPIALLGAIQRAVLPYINRQGDGLKAGASGIEVYKAIAPILAGYTLADVAPTIDLLRAAIDRQHDPRKSDALYQALWIAEGYISHARASGLECVRARAAILAAAQDDDGVLCDLTQIAAARMVREDIEALAVSKFDGERFDDFAKGKGQWLYGFLWRHSGLSTPAINEAFGRSYPAA